MRSTCHTGSASVSGLFPSLTAQENDQPAAACSSSLCVLVFCADDDPAVTDNFAALHVDECGDVVEKVSEVTASHVKLSEPVFSPRGALLKVGLWKINCNVLIYQTNTAFLTLHVYLIPRDPGLQQVVSCLIVTVPLTKMHHEKFDTQQYCWK